MTRTMTSSQVIALAILANFTTFVIFSMFSESYIERMQKPSNMNPKMRGGKSNKNAILTSMKDRCEQGAQADNPQHPQHVAADHHEHGDAFESLVFMHHVLISS